MWNFHTSTIELCKAIGSHTLCTILDKQYKFCVKLSCWDCDRRRANSLAIVLWQRKHLALGILTAVSVLPPFGMRMKMHLLFHLLFICFLWFLSCILYEFLVLALSTLHLKRLKLVLADHGFKFEWAYSWRYTAWQSNGLSGEIWHNNAVS